MHTRDTIVTYGLDRLRTSDTTIQALVQRWVNEILLSVAANGSFPIWRESFSITTVTSQQDYAMPYKLQSVYGILRGSSPGRPIVPMNDSDYKDLMFNITLEGIPYRFTLFGGPTTPLYNAKTVTLANGDATITGDTTVFTDAMAGSTIIFDDGSGYEYEILSRTSDTVIELTRDYVGTGGAGIVYAIEPVGRMYLRLYRIPSSAETITGVLQKRPVSIMADFDPIPIPPHRHSIMERGMELWIARYENEDDNEILSKEALFKREVDGWLGDIPHTQNPRHEFEQRPSYDAQRRYGVPIFPTTQYSDRYH